MLSDYLERVSSLAGPLVTCGPVLSWLEVDNRGNRSVKLFSVAGRKSAENYFRATEKCCKFFKH